MDRQESVTKRHISLSVHHPSAHTRLFLCNWHEEDSTCFLERVKMLLCNRTHLI